MGVYDIKGTVAHDGAVWDTYLSKASTQVTTIPPLSRYMGIAQLLVCYPELAFHGPQ